MTEGYRGGSLQSKIDKACQKIEDLGRERRFSMATLNVSLPDPMKDWVESQAATGRYRNASDYVRNLIRRDQERHDGLAQLQALITEGFESGISDRSLKDVLDAARHRARAAGTP